ncbi:MAG: hypothetical protein FP816_00705 [Desulfobacteraceae bacterium]|nr:hypothetical protein [Desulfobacteraceae bacterium]MBU4053230.1 hypothetical protein [Pseudomonadota bacterium]
MQQLTIRGLDLDVEKEIRKIAKLRGKSINQVIKEAVHKEFKTKDEKPAASLRNLAGGWTRKEAADFESAIKSCEQTDEEMWK